MPTTATDGRLITQVLILVGSRLGKFAECPAGMPRNEVERLAIELQCLTAVGGILNGSLSNHTRSE